MTSLKEFSVFPNLPAELRLKIWKHALSGPRIYHITYSKASSEFIISSPALTRVSIESRQAASELSQKSRDNITRSIIHGASNHLAGLLSSMSHLSIEPSSRLALPRAVQQSHPTPNIAQGFEFFDPKIDVLYFDCTAKEIYDFMLSYLPSVFRNHIRCLAIDQSDSPTFWTGVKLSDICKQFSGLEELQLVKRSCIGLETASLKGGDCMKRGDVVFEDIGMGVSQAEIGMGCGVLMEDSGYESDEEREVYVAGRKKLLREFKRCHEWWDAPWMEPLVTVVEVRGGGRC